VDVVLRLAIVAAVIVVAVAFGWWWNRRDGTVKAGSGGFDRPQLTEVGLTRADADAYALLLGSPTCAPCRTVRQILGEVEADRPELQWVYVDAGDHLDLARAHHVMRVPTLFVLDREGRILARTSGVPGKRDLLRVLDREGDLAALP